VHSDFTQLVRDESFLRKNGISGPLKPHQALCERQHAPDLEPAKAVSAPMNDDFDHNRYLAGGTDVTRLVAEAPAVEFLDALANLELPASRTVHIQ
jgi:hypothetical protein